jgi:hypothetical protein
MTDYVDLANRLLGIYNIPVNDGAGLLDGKDTFTRDFSKEHFIPPIQKEAAKAITELALEVAQLKELLLQMSAGPETNPKLVEFYNTKGIDYMSRLKAAVWMVGNIDTQVDKAQWWKNFDPTWHEVSMDPEVQYYADVMFQAPKVELKE